jgi:RecA-family ATPase
MSTIDFDNDSNKSTDSDSILLPVTKLNPKMWLSMDPRSIIVDEIIQGFPAGTVGAWIAPGGTGKSFLALELALAVASPLADFAGFKPSKHGKVLYLNAEDPHIQIGRRLAWLGEKISPEAKIEVHENLFIASAVGSLIDFSVKPNFNDADAEMTDIEKLIDFRDYRLIILDTLTRFHSLNENDNGQMTQLISLLEYATRQTRAAVLFLHHTNKAAIKDGEGSSQNASRGANALISNIRYSAYLVRMTPEEAQNYGIDPDRYGSYLRFGVAKQNYGLPQEERWFERREGGVLMPVTLTKTTHKPKKDINYERNTSF